MKKKTEKNLPSHLEKALEELEVTGSRAKPKNERSAPSDPPKARVVKAVGFADRVPDISTDSIEPRFVRYVADDTIDIVLEGPMAFITHKPSKRSMSVPFSWVLYR